MLRTFKDMNKEMRRTGTFKPVASKEELLQMVAQNNLLFTDIISKLGIMERFDVAWKHNNCSDIYEHLRADMEIENRNSNLQVKVRPQTTVHLCFIFPAPPPPEPNRSPRQPCRLPADLPCCNRVGKERVFHKELTGLYSALS